MLRLFMLLPAELVIRFNYSKDGGAPSAYVGRTTRPDGGTRKWGTHLEGTTVVTHKGENYINVFCLTKDGQPVEEIRDFRIKGISALLINPDDNEHVANTPQDETLRNTCCVIQGTDGIEAVVGPISVADAETFGDRYAEELGANNTVTVCQMVELTEFSKIPA